MWKLLQVGKGTLFGLDCLTNGKKRKAKKKYRKMAKMVRENKLLKEKFLESYESWKNHISHGNCVKFTYEMDKMVNEILLG